MGSAVTMPMSGPACRVLIDTLCAPLSRAPFQRCFSVTPSTLRDLMTRKANPMIAGGVVCGTWAREGDEITVTWLDERRRPRNAIERETGRLAAVLDRDLRLTLAS